MANNFDVTPVDNLQTAINAVNAAGGGTINLSPQGVYPLTTNVTLYSNIIIEGNRATFDFGGTAGEVTLAGAGTYSTGTITSITAGTAIVGSGTLWLANVPPGSQFFINGQWMQIAAVTSNTTMILAEGFDGNPFAPGASYQVATPLTWSAIKDLTIKNSTGSGINMSNARFITLSNVVLQSNNIGLTGSYVSELSINGLIPVLNVSHGITITNGGRFNWNSVNSASNGGNGIVLNAIRSMGFNEGVASANTSDGFNITGSANISLKTFDTNANGGIGIQFVSGNSGITIFDGAIAGNTSDGIKLTATTLNTVFLDNEITYNGGWGINISAGCDNSILTAITTGSNSSGALQDNGASTLKSSTVNNLA